MSIRLSLKYRIAIVIFALESVMMGVVLWETLQHSLNASREQSIGTEIAIMDLLSGMSRIALLTEEYAGLQPYLEDLRNEPRVERAMLADSQGRIVVSSDANDVGKPFTVLLAQPTGGDYVWRRQEVRNAAGTLGELAIGFSNGPLLRAYRESRDLGIIIAVSGMTAIAIAGIVMGRLLTRRLEKVTLAAQRFADGEPGVTTGVESRDELGDLARSFDAMARSVSRSQQELRDHREHLEELVAERTRELEEAHEELLRTERLATLGQLTATVSHELRNPLGVIRSSLYLIHKICDGEDEVLQTTLQRLDRSVSRCDHIIDELLDYTRIKALDERPVLLDPWLRTIVEEQQLPQDTRLATNWDASGITVTIDEERMRRAVINVLENACHALEASGQDSTQRVIDVTTRRADGRIEIVIADNGVGMAPDVLANIYKPLYSTKGFGVGLGIPVAKQIVEQHGGGIDVTSEADKGSTVTLWLAEDRA